MEEELLRSLQNCNVKILKRKEKDNWIIWFIENLEKERK